jgi:hypothetical protein
VLDDWAAVPFIGVMKYRKSGMLMLKLKRGSIFDE